MLKNLKNTEWSKRITLFVALFIMLSFVVVIIATFKGLEQPLVVFTTGLFTLADIVAGFYFWKAKNENLRKYARSLSNEDLDKIIKCWSNFEGGKNDDKGI